jgi:drug/metabolite transporter (DMT)-like permease
MTRPQALLAIHLVAFCFGMTGVLGELIQADAITITWARALFAVIFLSIASPVMLRQNTLSLKNLGKKWQAILLSGFFLTAHWGTFFQSVKVGGIAVATLGFASFPAFITLIERFILKEQVKRDEWLRLLVVTVGLILVTPSFTLADRATEGLLWGLLSGATFGILAVINRHALSGVNAFQVAAWQNMAVFLLLSLWAIQSVDTISLASWGWLLVLGLVCTGLAHLLFILSLRVLHARTAGLIVSLEPVYAIAFAWVLFHQIPSLRTLIGGLLMIGAILSASMSVQKQSS